MAAPEFTMSSAALFNQFYSQTMLPAASYKMWHDHYLATAYALKNGLTIPGSDYTAKSKLLSSKLVYKYPMSTSDLSPTEKSVEGTKSTAITSQDNKTISGFRSGMDMVIHSAIKGPQDSTHRSKLLSNVIGGGGATDLDPTQLLECQHCGKLCRKPCDLKRHLMMHTGEKPFKCKVRNH